MTSKIMIRSLIVNIILSTLKILGGVIFKCKTLVADGVHSLSDMLTDIIAIIGSLFANKFPDKEHPLGHGKLEYVTSILISILIIVMSITLLINVFGEQKIESSPYVLIIIVFSIVVKYFLSSYLIKKGKSLGSNILISSGLESKTDVLSSAFAFIFVLLSFLGKYSNIFTYADIIGSVIISIMIFKVGLNLFIENVKSVIGEVDLNTELNDNIKSILNNYKIIKKVRRITIIKYGQYRELTLELIINKNLKLKKLYNLETTIKKDIKSHIEEIKYITINFQI